MIIGWKEEYSVNDDVIDAQHKHLFDLLLSAKDMISKVYDKNKLIEIIHELTKYTLEHFEEEESRMIKHQYPEYEQHKEEHERFISEVEKFKSRVINDDPFVLDDIFMYLNQWIVNHIQTEDMKYKNKI